MLSRLIFDFFFFFFMFCAKPREVPFPKQNPEYLVPMMR